MPVVYTTHKGQKYFLCKGLSSRGAVRYYFSPNSQAGIFESLPEGYEIQESVNGRVSLVKSRSAMIRPEERTYVERAIAKHPKARNYRVDVKGKQIIVYENTGPDMDAIVDAFQQTMPFPCSRVDTLLAKAENFNHCSPMLRFTLMDPEDRIFRVERMYFLGLDSWRVINAVARWQN